MPNAQTDLLLPMLNGPDAPMVLHLAKSPIPEGVPSFDLSAIEECDFPGYAPITLNDFGETENDYEDVGEALTEVLRFTASEAIGQSQAVHFSYITRHPEGEPAQLLQVYALPVPTIFQVPGQELELKVRVMCEGLA